MNTHNDIELKNVRTGVYESPNEYNESRYNNTKLSSSKNEDQSLMSGLTGIKRLFGFGEIFAFSLTFLGTWEATCNNLMVMAVNGGPQMYSWGLIITWIGGMAQAASIAEMASILPISGAQYHWTYEFAPPRWRRSITWVQGWLTWFAWVSVLCGTADVIALIMQEIISMNHSSYEAQRWQASLLVIAICLLLGLMNHHAFWVVPWLELAGGLLHVCLWIIFVVVLVTMGTRHTSEFVFLKQSFESGWKDHFFSWNLGLIASALGFTGFDGAVHMSEEVRKPKENVPKALIWSVMLNGVFAFVMVLVLMYTMGDLEDILTSGFPIVTIFLNTTGSVGATTVLISLFLLFEFCVCIATVASVSRVTWAWSRDGGLPKWFGRLDAKSNTPVRAIWFPTVLVCILSLLNIGSTAAFGAIMSLSSMGLFLSYILAIGSFLSAKFRNSVKLGPWNMGRWGIPVNIFALIYTSWVCVFLPFPQGYPVSAVSMNYGGPIVGFVIFAAIILWFLGFNKRWAGPNPAIVKFFMEYE